MFDKIYDNCDPTEKEISCQCGEVLIRMSNGRPRRVMECCCVDCYQHLEWASVMGGPKVPIVPTLSYWDNDIDVVRGEEHLRVVLLRLRKLVGSKRMILMFLPQKHVLQNLGYF